MEEGALERRVVGVGASEMTESLIDTFGRVHTNLRISVTDRCNIRCFYCMPANTVEFLQRRELLTFEEIERVVRLSASLGVNKVRLTGGEPLVRKDLHRLVALLAAIPEIRDLGLTTNGILLRDQANDLFRAGLRRINISLDTLDPITFERIARRNELDRVLEGIYVAKRLGFDPIKVNAVAMRGLTEDDVVPLGHLARDLDLEVRFIEFMPLDTDNVWEREKVLLADEILDRLESQIMPLIPREHRDPQTPAMDFTFEDGRGHIGLVASVSRPFCEKCNRFRLTADGSLRNCLFSRQETDIKSLLRNGGTNVEIAAAIRECVAAKKEGHEINTARFIQPDRPMHRIGG